MGGICESHWVREFVIWCNEDSGIIDAGEKWVDENLVGRDYNRGERKG